MNRNIILGFASGLVFTASLIIGLIVADAATDQGGGEPRLPGALGDPIELITGTPISDPDAPVEFGQPIEPAQAAYVPIDSGSGAGGTAGSSSPGGGGSPAGGGGSPSDGDTGDDTTEFTVAPLAPVDFESRFDDFIGGDLYLEFLEFGPYRFLDLCADDGALPGCPFGVGGTVLAPLDHPTLGDFRLGTAMRPAFGPGSICGTPEENEHLFFVWANHPATFDITYYPPSRRSDPTTVTVSNTDPDNSEFARFERDAVEGRLATSPWPSACFTLTELPVGGEPYEHYIVEVEATNYFGGPTASETYTVDITEGSRPPVLFDPFRDRDDISIRALIPVKRFIEVPMISFVDQSDATTCADAEADDRFGEIIPAIEGGYIFSGPTDPRHESSPWSGYDPAYNGTTLIDITGLQQGTTYLVCIWWFETAESGLDPSSIVDREMRWVTTPNRPSAVIWTHTVENTSDHTIAAGSYTVGFSCGSGLPPVTLPSADMDAGTELPTDGSALCDYEGRPIQYPTVGFFITPRGFRHEFAIALDPSSPRSLQRFEVDLSTVGLSSDEPGPTLLLYSQAIEASDLGGDRWRTGVGETFEPPPEVPEELPDEIQIDTVTSGVEPAGRNGIRVNAEFDRPVRLQAFLERDIRRESEPCLTGPRPSFDSDVFYPGGFEQVHSFTLNGLCLDTQYWVWLQVWDEAGNSAIFADTYIHLVLPPGTRYYRGTGSTDGYHLSYTIRSLAYLGTADVTLFEVTIDGTTIDLRNPDQCFGRLAEAPSRSGIVVVGDEVTVRVNTVVSSDWAGVEGDCSPTDRGRAMPYRASITATIPIEDFAAGERLIPIEIPSPLNEGGSPWWDTGIGITGEVTG